LARSDWNNFNFRRYEATREFYFRGTPYPTDLDSKAAAKTSSSESHTIEEEESEEEDDHLMIDGDKTETDQEDRVHCFANRPSSAFVVTNENPPIWLKPTEVWEVSFADMTLSNKHTAAAGMVDESERGAALRFPRFKRRRPDKTPAEATTSVQIAQLFASQSKQHGSRGGKRA
jgi:ATP-dependent DNA ligase